MNIEESSGKLAKNLRLIQLICQDNSLTIESGAKYDNEIYLVLHYKGANGVMTSVARPLITTPF